jgi:hypothetical protein
MLNAVPAITEHFVFAALDSLVIHTQFVKNLAAKVTQNVN